MEPQQVQITEPPCYRLWCCTPGKNLCIGQPFAWRFAEALVFMTGLRLVASLALAGGLCAMAWQNDKPTPAPDKVAAKADDLEGADVAYGHIKEVTKGQKIVIGVEKGKDKTFRLSDPKAGISVAEDLAVGDPVKIVESKRKDERSVQIVRDVRPEAVRGDQKRTRTSDSGKQQ
jgi:hypothetical protein